ncbi:MAG: hypothetical protein PF517_09490 [Salinivirgaceae bacterium]|jgi:hypothetical protein|nr:hypothetical protein [Salinivirgaceae bacterium]
MEYLLPIWEFVKTVLLLTIGQVISILGVFFFFGLILYLLARFTRTTFVKSIGYNFDVYITGWIGTPVHELGHALFCIPFGHKIVALKLFKPDSKDGSLGYVNHSYNPNNIWHLIGNFFIGFGPILFGSFILYILIKYLVPDNHQIIKLVNSQQTDLTNLGGVLALFKSLFYTGVNMFTVLFTQPNMHSWQFWVFIYLSLCISSHMELSPADLKGLRSGMVSIIILFIIVNVVTVFFNIDISRVTGSMSQYSYMTSGIFMFATFISTFFFSVAFICLNLFSLIRYRRLFHPFA